MLDCAAVVIGDNALPGPNVQRCTATHPFSAAERASRLEFAKSIKIGDNVRIGGSSIVNPGVTIGAGTTIGFGSIVTRDVPPNVVAAGNPCRVIRELD